MATVGSWECSPRYVKTGAGFRWGVGGRHAFLDTRQGDRVADDLPGRLVIGMAHASDPCVAPGQDPVGTNLGEKAGDLEGRFTIGA